MNIKSILLLTFIIILFQYNNSVAETPFDQQRVENVSDEMWSGLKSAVQESGLSNNGLDSTNYLGYSISMTDDWAMIGVFGKYASSGAVHVFKYTGSKWIEFSILVPEDIQPGDQFGFSVSILGNRAIVGANQVSANNSYGSGAVYVYDLSTANAWVQRKKIRSGAPNLDVRFGESVSLGSNRLVVGATLDIGLSTATGSAYVFDKVGSNWIEDLKVFDSSANTDARFGSSVSISGDTFVVGAQNAYSGSLIETGYMYIYAKSTGVWVREAKIKGSDTSSYHHFGKSVDIDGNRVIAYSERKHSAYIFDRTGVTWTQTDILSIGPDDTSAFAGFGQNVIVRGNKALIGFSDFGGGGTAYLFEKSGATWTLEKTFLASDRQNNDDFGFSVGMSNEKILIGSVTEDEGGFSNNGATYAFKNFSGTWTQTQKLNADDHYVNDRFGFSVGIDGNYAIVGAYGKEGYGFETGAAYIFKYINNQWRYTEKLLASDAAAGDRFGYSVSIKADVALVGAYKNDDAGASSGSAYVFTNEKDTWVESKKLVASDAMAGDEFGKAVNITFDKAIIGAEFDDTGGSNSIGSAYIFEYDLGAGLKWDETAKLVSDDAAAFRQFGHSVSIDADTAIIGEIRDNTNGFDAGAAYIFKKNGTWSQVIKLLPSDGDSDDSFGSSVSISGSQVVIGASFDESGFASSYGSAYVFDKFDGTWKEKEKLVPIGDGTTDNFGVSVSILNDKVFIGADQSAENGGNSGVAYEYTKASGSWSFTKFIATEVVASDKFGRSIDISDNKVIVGTFSSDKSFVFKYNVDPTAVDNSYTIDEDDATQSFSVLTNDTDPDGGLKEIILVTQPTYASTVINGNKINYTVNANYCNDGVTTDDFTYTLNGESTATVSVTVNCVDDLGTAVNVTAVMNEGPGAGINVHALNSVIDIDGGSIILSVTQPMHGVATVFNDEAYYRPHNDYCNDGLVLDTFDYTINGGSTATISVSVTCVGGDPIAVDDNKTLNEDDSEIYINVLSNDISDQEPLLFTANTQPTNGVVAVTGQGFRYTPNANYCNDGVTTDDFEYTINYQWTATVHFTVNCEDDLPVAVDDMFVVNEDSGFTNLNVIDNDTDIDPDPINVIFGNQPVNGTVNLTGGQLSYRPDGNYCNDGITTDDFTYKINGGSVATVSMSVTCLPDTPVANDDAFTIIEDANTAINVFANDQDPDGAGYAATVISQPANGVAGDLFGIIYYTANDNYCNDGVTTDDFVYQVAGGDTATVSMTVTCVDDAPVAMDDSFVVNEDILATLDALANDDIDGGDNKVLSVTQPQHGTASHGTRMARYKSDLNYCTPDGGAADTFTYTMTGGTTATISVIVTCVDDKPVAVFDEVTIIEDVNTVIDVIANDTDIDGGPIVITSFSSLPQHGTLVNNGNNVTYQPDENYCNSQIGFGADSFRYVLNDSSGAFVTVHVTCVDDPATAVDDSVSLLEDTDSIKFVASNDFDPDGGAHGETIASITQPANGTMTIGNIALSVIYVPANNYCNDGITTDDATYTLTGGSTAIVSFTVTCVNDQPSFNNLGNQVVSNQGNSDITSWMFDIDMGASNENSQQVLDVHIAVVSDSNNILSTVDVANDGKLTFTTTENTGVALIEISLQDNGGTVNSGVDTSIVQTLSITKDDTIFGNGFEATSTLKVINKLEKLSKKSNALQVPVYNFDLDSVIYYDYEFWLNNDYHSSKILHQLQMWIKEISNYEKN